MPIEPPSHNNHVPHEEEEDQLEINDTAGEELEGEEVFPIGMAVRNHILSRFRRNEEKKVLYSMAAYAYITKNRNLTTEYMRLIARSQPEAAEALAVRTLNFVIAHTRKININVQESIDAIMENQVIRTPGIGRDNIVETLTREFHCMNEEEINELRSTIQTLNPEGCLALGLGTDDNEGHGYISVNLFDF